MDPQLLIRCSLHAAIKLCTSFEIRSSTKAEGYQVPLEMTDMDIENGVLWRFNWDFMEFTRRFVAGFMGFHSTLLLKPWPMEIVNLPSTVVFHSSVSLPEGRSTGPNGDLDF